MAKVQCLGLLLGLLLLCELSVASCMREPQDSEQSGSVERRKKKKKHPYTSPAGLFIQVNTLALCSGLATAVLPRGGRAQH